MNEFKVLASFLDTSVRFGGQDVELIEQLKALVDIERDSSI